MNNLNFWVPTILAAGGCLVCFLTARSAIKSAQRAQCEASEHINFAIDVQLAAQAAQLKAEKAQQEALSAIRDAQKIKNEYTQKFTRSWKMDNETLRDKVADLAGKIADLGEDLDKRLSFLERKTNGWQAASSDEMSKLAEKVKELEIDNKGLSILIETANHNMKLTGEWITQLNKRLTSLERKTNGRQAASSDEMSKLAEKVKELEIDNKGLSTLKLTREWLIQLNERVATLENQTSQQPTIVNNIPTKPGLYWARFGLGIGWHLIVKVSSPSGCTRISSIFDVEKDCSRNASPQTLIWGPEITPPKAEK